ncbi:hypothetical protein DB31_2138 [Hyalangium minutum]|uniref:Ig-like domain-containing protein n=1 Tax=Hyalangium minutum TaxID=394096 RepID=A0A085W9I1_9BACT|nr:hypothetical protein DB31_2138 [Hyalangium minutum]
MSISTGCVVSDKPPPAQPGDVTLLWTFGGLRCDQARDVYGVNVTIPGEALANDGKYACSTSGVDGITLHDFAPGSYAFTLQAVNFQNQILFEASGTFIINGSKTVVVDLTPTGNPGSYAYLSWSFPGNMSCAQAGVSTVEVLLDGLAPHSAPCTAGQTPPGLQTPYLAPGLHSIELIARASSGQPLYTYRGGLTTRAYDPVSADYSLAALTAQLGDVTFLWTFNGLRCDQARDVYGVNITIPGEVLSNNGRYACTSSGVDGITLHDFAPGSYNFTLQAVDFQNQILFEANGSFTINGDKTVRVDLAPVGNPASYAYLNWSFPGNASCAQAGVASVDITLDDLAPRNFACNVGQTSPGLQTPSLSPGSHFIEFIARDASGKPLYYFNGELVTQAYNPVSAAYSLYAIGGASISWRFTDGSVTFDCNTLDPTGNLQVGINFQDTSTGEWIYGALGDWHRCADKPIVYSYLRPGTYKVSLYAKTSSNVEYRSTSNIAPIQVQAHVFPGPSGALDVMMYRQ